jgi:hypothetical protein
MENLVIKREGSKLTLEIYLRQTLGPSATGKTQIVATSHGNQPVPGTTDTFIGINCFRYVTPRRGAGQRGARA